MDDVRITPTKYSVSLVPENVPQWYLWSLTVEYRGRDQWVVLEHPDALDVDGKYEYEPSPSSRTDEFRDRFYHDKRTALEIAEKYVHRITINGITAAQAIARQENRHG